MASELKVFKVDVMPAEPEPSAIYYVATSAGRFRTAITGVAGEVIRWDGGYEYEQAMPAAVWTINHNLGAKPAAVTVTDTNDDQIVFFGVAHPSNNQTVLTFSAAFAGLAILT